MRRALSLALLTLGVFAVAVAVLLPTYVYPSLAKVPLDQNTTAVLEGQASKVLAVAQKDGQPSPEIRQNVNLTATAKVQANFARAEMTEGSDVAVWMLAIQVVDTADNTIVNASKRQVCFDRRTSEGYVPAAGETDPKCQPDSSYVAEPDTAAATPPGQTPPERDVNHNQPGLNFKFPFGTEKKDYQVYEDTTEQPVTAKFSGTDQVNGVDVYKFVQKVPDTQLQREKVPGSLVGADQDSVDATLFYSGTITTWVEPVTGVEIKQTQEQHQELRVDGQTGATTVFDGALTFNAKTIADLVDQANANKGKLQFITTTGPIVFGIAGGLFLIAGAFLLFRRRKADPTPPQDQPTAKHAANV